MDDYVMRKRPQRENLQHVVSSELRGRIFSAQLRADTKIDQDALADEFGVSRIPVREALITLESEGLVYHKARRGVFVSPLTRTDVLDHFHIYGLISKLTAERAAMRLSPEELLDLQRIQAQLEESNSASLQEELNFHYHRTINVRGGSRRTRFVMRLLSNGLPTRFYETHESWAAEANKHHRMILRKLESRDVEGAGEAMLDHIVASGQRAVELLEASGFWATEADE